LPLTGATLVLTEATSALTGATLSLTEATSALTAATFALTKATNQLPPNYHRFNRENMTTKKQSLHRWRFYLV